MGAINVRTARLSDAGSVERVFLASYPPLMAKAYDQELLRRALPVITRPNTRLLASGTYYVAETGGLIIGCGGWTHEEPGATARTQGIAHIRHFAVSEDQIGRGVGRALFDRCEIDARMEKVRMFKCFASHNAEGFYAALGFRLCGEIDVPMPPDLLFPSLLMERRI